MSKERSSLSITALNGLRAVEDGVRNEDGLSNVAVNKGMLVSVKSPHVEEERKNEDSQKRKYSEEKQQESEAKRRKEEDLKKIDGHRKSIKELDERESNAF